MDQKIWKKIIEELRPISPSVEMLLKTSKIVSFEGNDLTLAVYYKFHKERLEDYRNKNILESVIQKVTEKTICVHCVLEDLPLQVQKEVELVEPGEDISDVAEQLFG